MKNIWEILIGLLFVVFGILSIVLIDIPPINREADLFLSGLFFGMGGMYLLISFTEGAR